MTADIPPRMHYERIRLKDDPRTFVAVYIEFPRLGVMMMARLQPEPPQRAGGRPPETIPKVVP